MKKPQDPRKHGLKEPEPKLIEEHRIKLGKKSDSYSSQYATEARCSLSEAMECWEREKVKASYDNKTVFEGPFIETKYSDCFLSFRTSRPNPHYQYELVAYNAEVKAYEEKVAAYDAWIDNKKKGIREDIDKHILRLEHKIANLKASRDNEPIPFPED